jgi:hypothetical protein
MLDVAAVANSFASAEKTQRFQVKGTDGIQHT